MIVGIDASRYRHPEPTGVEVYSDRIIDGLIALAKRQKKHQLRLYTPHRLPHVPAEDQCVIPGKRLWTQWHLDHALRKDPPDVLFVPSHVPPFRTLTSPQPTTKIVTTIHDVCFRRFAGAYSLRQFAYLELTTRLSSQHAARLIVPSQATADDLTHFYSTRPRQISVIPHGFTPSPALAASPKNVSILHQFGLTPEQPFFLFVGRLETKKNIERLVEAFAIFRQKNPDWHLILGGSRGVGFPSILKRLDRKHLLDHVVMPGYLHAEEKEVLLHFSRGFVFPSLAEGFGFPILEAAQARRPILASKIPAFEAFTDLVSVWVDPLEVERMAQGLERLARTSVPTPSHAHALKRFSWENAAQSVWNLLTDPSL